MSDFTVLQTFKRRMDKLGIKCEFMANYPWIYLDRINDKKVTEKFMAEHGFTIAFLPAPGETMQITDINELFKLIRKYL